MTGKSLGLRSGSTGSLPLQQSNGSLYNHASPGIPRKPSKSLLSNFREKERYPSKSLLSNYREKERCFTCLLRWLCRRKVGMAIMFSLAVLVFVSSLFTFNKGAPGSSSLDFIEGLMGEKISHKEAFPGHLLSHFQRQGIGGTGNHTAILNSLVSSVNKTRTSHTTSDTRVFKGYRPYDHPCRNFGLPPPPPTKGRRLGPRPCPVCYLPAEQAKDSMPTSTSISPVLDHLTYVHDENPKAFEWHGGSIFGGYPSLQQRSDSFDIKESMEVHCGFVKGSRPGRGSGFDVDEDDLPELEKFHDVIVASAIFGNYDIIQQPSNVSEDAMKSVPFYMFIDEETEKYMRNASLLNSSRRIGIWKIIVVRNIPYTDSRRNGKIPKLLLHRLFPNVRYSIWIDGKLKLVADPYQILERFLWRQNATFAISRHYTRFDVFVEAEANKAAGKYDNASINFQIDFYKKEGLTPYAESKLPITSDVPEGCVIIKEHIPITNLFTCLWFNEVDRFTSRDQLSFSTVRDKIMSRVDWSINMFLDCERRNFVVQTYHRELLEHMPPPPPLRHSHPVVPLLPPSSILRMKSVEPVRRISGRKNPFRRRSGSKRHRKANPGRRGSSSQ